MAFLDALSKTHVASHAMNKILLTTNPNKNKSLELQRIAESYFQHTESTFSYTCQSMKRRIIAKHLKEPK